MSASILKPKLISVGLSVCRVNSGAIVVSAHEGEQRILLEISEAECDAFIRQLEELLRESNPGPNQLSNESTSSIVQT
jgi:hypothetical protein